MKREWREGGKRVEREWRESEGILHEWVERVGESGERVKRG